MTNCDGSRINWVRMGASETVGPMTIMFRANLVRPLAHYWVWGRVWGGSHR